MTLYVGDETDKYNVRSVQDIWVGDDTSTPRALEEVWVGDLGGNPRLVWARLQQNTLTATPVAYNLINLSWTQAGPAATYELKRGTTVIYSGTGLAYANTGLNENTFYSYTLTSLIPGNQVVATASATTPVRPTTQKSTGTLSATRSASFQGDGDNRYVSEMYAGYYGSNHGRQKSMAYYPIPSDVRNCVSVDKVEMRFYTRHHYYFTGGKVRVAPHRQNYPGGFPATFPGPSYPHFGEWSADRGKWIGGKSDGWIDITGLKPSGWAHTMAEEFRTQGGWGFVLHAPNDSSLYYGYYDGAGQTNPPAIRITYTVYQ